MVLKVQNTDWISVKLFSEAVSDAEMSGECGNQSNPDVTNRIHMDPNRITKQEIKMHVRHHGSLPIVLMTFSMLFKNRTNVFDNKIGVILI